MKTHIPEEQRPEIPKAGRCRVCGEWAEFHSALIIHRRPRYGEKGIHTAPAGVLCADCSARVFKGDEVRLVAIGPWRRAVRWLSSCSWHTPALFRGLVGVVWNVQGRYARKKAAGVCFWTGLVAFAAGVATGLATTLF